MYIARFGEYETVIQTGVWLQTQLGVCILTFKSSPKAFPVFRRGYVNVEKVLDYLYEIFLQKYKSLKPWSNGA